MKILNFILPLVLIASCASQNDTPADVTADDTVNEQLCGGYTDQREPSDNEMALFRQVTASQSTSYTPLSVSTQVVAGLNYKFWCRYEDSASGESGHCWVLIYKDLQGNATLTGVTKEQ